MSEESHGAEAVPVTTSRRFLSSFFPAGSSPTRGRVREALKSAAEFISDLFETPPEATREESRLLWRLGHGELWEEITQARGLTGLLPGRMEEWELGYRLHGRLHGRLQFSDVETGGIHLATGLGLVRARQMRARNTYDLTPDQIAVGMVQTHREWHGSVVFVGRSDRSDRVDIWIGLHDRLAPLAEEFEREKARREAEKDAAANAVKAAPVTGTQLEEARARNQELSEQFARLREVPDASGNTASRSVSGSPGRTRTSVCDDVRDLVCEAPAGLTATELKTKTGHSASRIYACLNEGLDTGELTKVGRKFVITPKTDGEQS
ncbi:hypothetical protein [Streptomyces sp. GESEQ-35]|uniref:hypothetical protein n=1 Tax=Streptomyces sp. GESEQ-35 TaxID=2812657 RepID=UPI001B322CDB|nr:hypothetical protein [Streptomyces sp. GESEQ-35]